MKIAFTSSAADRLAEGAASAAGRRLKLVYDTEGCGCALDGVPALRRIDAPEAGARRAENSEPFEVYYDPQHEIFFENALTVDYNKERSRYVLKSDNQIYTSNLRLIP